MAYSERMSWNSTPRWRESARRRARTTAPWFLVDRGLKRPPPGRGGAPARPGRAPGTPEGLERVGVPRAGRAQRLHRHVDADLVAELEAVGDGLCHAEDAHWNSGDVVLLDTFPTKPGGLQGQLRPGRYLTHVGSGFPTTIARCWPWRAALHSFFLHGLGAPLLRLASPGPHTLIGARRRSREGH